MDPNAYMSDAVDQLAAALVKAQEVMQPAVKDRSNPAFKSKYADLSGVWEACGDALQKNGLAVVQMPLPPPAAGGEAYPQGFVLRTLLLHKSGQWVRSDLPMYPDMANPHKIGGAITYARRYALSAMVGVYQDDDDGNTAAGYNQRANGNGYHRPEPPAPAPAPAPAKAEDTRSFAEFMRDAAAAAGVTVDDLSTAVVADMVAACKLPAALRDAAQCFENLNGLYTHNRAYVRRMIGETVRAIRREHEAEAVSN